MWDIYEKRSLDKVLCKLPTNILERYEFWKNVVQVSGPDGLKSFPGFKDHALKGEWQGHRSSYLNISYRVIYKIEKNEVQVYVIDVTNHDYRRK